MRLVNLRDERHMGEDDMRDISGRAMADFGASPTGLLSDLLEQHCSPTFERDAETTESVAGADDWMVDHGQIARMRLPHGWTQGTSFEGTIGNDSYLEYLAPGAPAAKLIFYFRGYRVTEQASAAFRSMLDMPPHFLTRMEIENISEILRDKRLREDFSLFLAKTAEHNGKRILVIEGRFRKIQQDARVMLVDSDGTGSVVQEIFYQAPKETYLHYSSDANRAIDSIVWK